MLQCSLITQHLFIFLLQSKTHKVIRYQHKEEKTLLRLCFISLLRFLTRKILISRKLSLQF